MPWHIVANHSECPSDRPVAVVLDSDGSVAGCHANEDDAKAQLAALYANERARPDGPPAPLHERRAFELDVLEVRTMEDGTPELSGHAAVFGQLSENLGGFHEMVAPGAFKRALKHGADVRLLINHDPSLILGRNKAKTLRIEEDAQGLAVSATLPDTSYARDLVVSMQRGDITQMSFGFQVVKDDWGTLPDGVALRTLREVRLFDVSAVTFPAYPTTNAHVRAVQHLDGLVRVLGLRDLPDSERQTLLDQLADDRITTDSVQALRPAMTALADLLARTDPPRQHSVPLALLHRRHALNQRYFDGGAP